ncbi:MAG: hypothetical protein LBL82_03250 [Oscillospiraceae bacterium]|jgi:hypothetical protein|nr:hypothetical protein [Oscillospiraceae bacterium]
MMMRSGSKQFAVAIIPLGFVPLAHFIGEMAVSLIDASATPLETILMRVGLDLIALVGSCLLLGFFARRFEKKGIRRVFLISCGMFDIVLAIALIMDVVKPFIESNLVY